MTVNKHTPGPWCVDDYTNVCCLDGGLIAVAGDGRATLPRGKLDICRSNGRLIAAAPDLLMTLQNLVGLAEGHCRDLHHYKAALDDARAAIAKATGEAS